MIKLLIFLIFLSLGIVLGGGYYFWKSKPTDFEATPVKKERSFSIVNAPKDSEKGTIQSMMGTIKWTSRIATEASQITKPVPIQQGEELVSGEDGNAIITYQNGLTISIFSNSHLSFIQILPTNYVLNQLKGTVEYQISKSTPLAIRSLHLLTQMNEGDVSIAVSAETKIIDIIVKRGTVKIAFNDLQNVSNAISLREGDNYLFDDKNRQGTIKTSR